MQTMMNAFVVYASAKLPRSGHSTLMHGPLAGALVCLLVPGKYIRSSSREKDTLPYRKMHAADEPRASAVWKYFERIERNHQPFSQCSLCFYELGGHRAGNAKKHLLTRHGPELFDDLQAEDGGSRRIVPHQLLNEIRSLNEQVTYGIGLWFHKRLRDCSW